MTIKHTIIAEYDESKNYGNLTLTPNDLSSFKGAYTLSILDDEIIFYKDRYVEVSKKHIRSQMQISRITGYFNYAAIYKGQESLPRIIYEGRCVREEDRLF